MERFSILDVIRVLGGILFFNAIFSWWFTGSSTWGYNGKYIDPNFYKFHILQSHHEFTDQELALYNGTDPDLPIYIAINGSVFDVSRSRKVYGPRGSYHKLSGRDCARVYVTGCLGNDAEYTHDLRGLDEEEVKLDLDRWKLFYLRNSKYWYVGNVHHEPLQGDPPAECEHVKWPGSR